MNYIFDIHRAASHLMPHAHRHINFEIRTHEHHARLYHVTVAPIALSAFWDAVSDIDVQNLEYVPFMRFALAKKLTQFVGKEFSTALRAIIDHRESGGFTIGVQGTAAGEVEYVKFGTAIAYLMGPANFDSMSSSYYARFDVRHTDDSDSYLRQAYRLFTLHTDGTFVEEATDWLLMMKFTERNATGGESRLLHLDDWEDLQSFFTDALARQPFTFTAPLSKNVSQTTQRPTFFLDRGRPGICFIDQFVQPETQEQADYLHSLSESIERSRGTTSVPLPVGDLVVLNNRFWLHGRAPFEVHPELHRELMRIRGRFSVQ